MKLYFSHPSPYARKARITMIEAGLEDQVEGIAVNPWADPEGFRDLNPFGRVPTLVLDDGQVLFQSNVVCEYFDHLNKNEKLFPEDWSKRLPALRLLALADNFLDSCVVQRMEQLFHEDTRSEKLYERQNWSIGIALDVLEDEAENWKDNIDIGLIGVACALGYRDFRFEEHDWRKDHPRLAAWYAAFQKRPSMKATEFNTG